MKEARTRNQLLTAWPIPDWLLQGGDPGRDRHLAPPLIELQRTCRKRERGAGTRLALSRKTSVRRLDFGPCAAANNSLSALPQKGAGRFRSAVQPRKRRAETAHQVGRNAGPLTFPSACEADSLRLARIRGDRRAPDP
ncbi:hypothetical protein [Bradyrhizobium sp. STM 3843]|uniref:hypothetical protein n=1 Tax=Bradyrhizobium sp. STM 3843 TaxID=551947 RepID=UPI001111926F|nr:hypothetical protein [Bradyrhizobium sp. STM 3843]